MNNPSSAKIKFANIVQICHPRKFSPTKIKAHTVLGTLAFSIYIVSAKYCYVQQIVHYCDSSQPRDLPPPVPAPATLYLSSSLVSFPVF